MPGAEKAADGSPWYAAYPPPKNQSPETLSREDFLQMLKQGQQPGKDFVLVDLRRADHEGGSIKGSINLPAQSLYPSIPTLYALFMNASVRMVIWYCGSSKGRGTRAAAWFDDYIQTQSVGSDMKSVALLEGIKGWVSAGKEYTDLVVEYDEGKWM